MTYEGAKGKTAHEMQAVFHLPADNQKLRNGYQAMYNDINMSGKPYKLSTANALWVENTYPLLNSYVDAIKTYYNGGITNLDFIHNAASAASTINQWVEDKTARRIQNILSSGDISPSTKLILTNAIYFKGEWINQFEVRATQNKEFTTSGDEKFNVSMMEQTDDFQHAEVGNIQLLKLPYKGDDVSMMIVLPKNNDLSSVERELTSQQIIDWNSKLEDHHVHISMPKFKIETREHMTNDLEAMGMPTAFSRRDADFSGIATIKNPSENLYISDVIHQTFIDNKEDGTEAAAATAVVMGISAVAFDPQQKTYIFNANHPFIFLIQHNQTGNILFMGRIASPSSG
jgi:serpin B